MAIPPFDPSKAVSFDLARGQIQLPETTRGLLFPSDAFAQLCRGVDADGMAAFGRAVGESIGHRVRAKLTSEGAAVRDASIEAVVEHLAGQWGVTGLGRLGLERWGKALVVVVDDAPSGGESERWIAPLLGAAFSTAAAAPVRCVHLHRDGARDRFAVLGQASADRVREWLGSGMPWGEALVRLHANGGDA